ncbi:hypothetical protein AMK34_18850 [Amycolatopsis sp. CB00013]|nr:hypothetical protein AMK34_18850 [Amycolatopsis sp. CB00013]
MKLAHDSVINLRDKRIELFAAYIQSVYAAAMLANKLESAPSIESVKEMQVEYQQLQAASEAAGQAVRIIASDQILALFKSNALVLFHGFIHRYLVPPLGATEEETKANQEKALKDYKDSQRERSTRIWSYYHDLTNLVRADLGITPMQKE